MSPATFGGSGGIMVPIKHEPMPKGKQYVQQ